MSKRARVRAPELRGRSWINTGGKELSLAGLRGRIVVLDFWTFCCVNCLHVLDELRELERVPTRSETPDERTDRLVRELIARTTKPGDR